MTTSETTSRPRRNAPWSSYAVKREARGDFSGRRGYLKAKGSKEPFRLCQILGRRDRRHKTMPWVTFVLGSGCVEVGSGPDGRTLAHRVGDALGDRSLPGDESAPSLAQLFAESLIEDRLGSLDTPVPTTLADDDEISPIAPPLVLAACLLTRVFHTVKGARPEAVRRWDDDVATLDPDDPGPQFDDIAEFVPPAAHELRVARKLLGAQPDSESVAPAVSDLLKQVLDGLSGNGGRKQLSIQHLRLVTEIAWYYLVGDTTAYPGWTDLLLRLMLRGDDPASAGSRRTRPRFLNLKLPGGYVCELLEKSSRLSWRRRVESPDREFQPAHIYDAAAAVLWAQQEMLVESRNPTDLPPASTFVTSFDLELEMALWAQSQGRAFSVAVPVHLLRDADDDQADLCWLLAQVEPDVAGDWSGGLAAMRKPRRWRLLHANFNPRELCQGPLVIHLNGCPLLRLPDPDAAADRSTAELRQDLAALGLLDEIDDELHLIHAVTVDEYLALRQSEAELFWASEFRATQSQRASRALPHVLAADSSMHARFWMVLGVPVADPAIRHRITSHLTISRFRGDSPDSRSVGGQSGMPPRAVEAPEHARNDVDGVAVNKRIDDDEASILHWLGLDVVQASCAKFTDDLVHYTQHVAVERLRNRVPDTGCELGYAGDRS
ncbi:MAG: hypothetical protein QOE45_272 [Frankiaceae bacterium]|jgi:hypothetical protein|nr:hypothetical protein [Frankiaceae bacterium]